MANVKPIPEGMNSLTPHITVKNAKEAIKFYTDAFGAKEMSRALTPDGRIMHASLRIGGGHLFLNDEFPEMKGCNAPVVAGQAPFVINIYVENADQTFDRAVKAGAKAKMPVSNMFWGDRYGQVIDPFGYHWSIAQHIEDVTPEDMKKRSAEMFAQPAHK
jgi:PhnB protein